VGAQKKVTTTRVLVRALKDRDVGVRAEAVELLGVLGQIPDGKTKAEVARVLGMALKDQDPGLRLQAVEKLGEMDAAVANKYLISALRDPNTFVRTKVLSVIGARERKSLLSQQQPAAQPGALAAQTP
jgi:HEAT repeat protein